MHMVFIELKTFLYKGTARRSWFWWNSWTHKAPTPKGHEAVGPGQGVRGVRLLPPPAAACAEERVGRQKETRWIKGEREKRK